MKYKLVHDAAKFSQVIGSDTKALLSAVKKMEALLPKLLSDGELAGIVDMSVEDNSLFISFMDEKKFIEVMIRKFNEVIEEAYNKD